MRDQAFADLGDTTLTDGGVDGNAPQFTITERRRLPAIADTRRPTTASRTSAR